MLKKYIAYYDNGNSYGSFTYYSSSRAGSKQNLKDAKKEARLIYGKVSKNMDILSVERRK